MNFISVMTKSKIDCMCTCDIYFGSPVYVFVNSMPG
jgi:hypothetical protein